MSPTEPIHHPALLGPAACAHWLAAYDRADQALPPDHPDRQPTSGSLRLRALVGPGFAEVWPLLAPLAKPWPLPHLLADQCWLRCQHPAASRPAGQHPHGWHQDGALGCRFNGPEALAELLTVWIPLVDCGDAAPSLQWVVAPTPHLLGPHQLTDAAVAASHGPEVLRQARLRAGDALVFGGTLLHRTHATPAMTQRRVSLELRLCSTLPARLAHERLLPWPR